MTFGDTIAAISTAPGKAGVAVIRVSGPDSFAILARLTGRAASPGRVVCAEVREPGGDRRAIDRAVILAFAAPHGYTGEDAVEFQCHGGAVTPRRVLEACFAAGARLARRGEFTERAFLNGRLSLSEARSVLDLIDAKTVRAADAALRGLSGEGDREARALYDRALALAADVEHSLDVEEGALPEGFLAGVSRDFAAFRSAVAEAARRAREGRILREGALVALAGAPNAGKSSLMNALLGTNRAIVSATPGTTRDSIEEWLDVDGWPVRLVDTAGLRETADAIEGEGVRRAEALVAEADVVLALAPAGEPAAPVRTGRATALAVTSKCDLARGPGINVSAVTGEGLDALRAAIASALDARAAEGGSGGGPEDDGSGRDARLAALEGALAATEGFGGALREDALVMLGGALRRACEILGSTFGATYSQDLLDRLFSRFCVGK